MVRFENVFLGKDVAIDETAVIGQPPRGRRPGELQTVIGDGTVIRSGCVVYAGTTIGAGTQLGHGVMIREDNRIGQDCSVGTNAVLEPGNIVGDRTRIHSGCFLENVTLGSDVFLGPNVVFTDDPHPPCRLCTDFVRGAVVEDKVAIGANSTLVPGIRIGRGALIGAGSVVTKDVPAETAVAGNPARYLKSVHDIVCRAKAAES